MEFSVNITNSAGKAAKRLDPSVRREAVRLVREVIAHNPFDSERLQKPLEECRSFHFKQGSVHYRIAYRVIADERRVDIVLIGPREGFYGRLKRILR